MVLTDVTLHIPAGKTVALCGPSGSGKTTILNLFLRFYDPSAGIVTLDGRDLRSIQRDSFRRHCALVQQETFLFNDSIFDNIRYGHGEATMEQVIAAAKAANAHEFISALPQRLRHQGRRARRALERRAKTTHHHRPRLSGQSQRAAFGRTHQQRRTGFRSRHHHRPRPLDAGAHHRFDQPSAQLDQRSRLGLRDRKRPYHCNRARRRNCATTSTGGLAASSAPPKVWNTAKTQAKRRRRTR